MKNSLIAVYPRRARGIAMPVLIAIVVVLIVLGVVAWFLMRPHTPATAVAPATPGGQQVAAAASAPPPAKVAAMTTDELLTEARKAVGEQRLLAPAGNNAFEFYLKVLERQPNNKVAQDALRETFPIGANAAEQSINQNQFDQAQREIDLLAKSDPNNYTLTILRSKLDAQRKLSDRQQQQQAQQEVAQQQQADAAKKKEAAEKLAARLKAEQDAAAARVAASRKPTPAPTNAPANNTPTPAPTTAQQVRIQDAKLLQQVPARYPVRAQRARREGWVDVEFTVGVDGAVSKAHVVDSKPGRIFDRSAVDAVERWKFQPALKNGQPMAVTMRRRINFVLKNGN